MIHSFKLTREHRSFLSEERKDPITQDSLEIGDEIVFCAECKSAYLKDTWLFKNEECCNQKSTLSQFPISRPLSLGTRTRVQSNVNAELNQQHRMGIISKFRKLNIIAKIFIVLSVLFFTPFIITPFILVLEEINKPVKSQLEELKSTISSKYKYETYSELDYHEGFMKIHPRGNYDLENKWVYIDTLGNKITETLYLKAHDFSEGLAGCMYQGLFGFIDTNGKTAIDFKYDEVGLFSEGLASVKLKNKWGAIDKQGNIIIPIQYEFIGLYQNGIMAACDTSKLCGCIDKNENMTIPFKYLDIGDLIENRRLVSSGKIGDFPSNINIAYLDEGGREVIKLERSIKGYDFFNGLATVYDAYDENKIWKINKNGTKIETSQEVPKSLSGSFLRDNPCSLCN